MSVDEIKQADTSTLKPVLRIGTDQLNNPTPIWMKNIVRVFQFLSGIWALLPQDLLTNFSDHQYSIINRWIIVCNAILFFAIKFFGWDVKTVTTPE